MKHLLIVAHSPSENTQTLEDAVIRGASNSEIEGVELRVCRPLACSAEDVLWADAVILGTTENFGYMSGAMKDFFDRIYYPCQQLTEGLSYAMYIRAGNDGLGARTSIERIVSGLNWRAVQDPITCTGEFKEEFKEACEELGMTIAAGLEAGIF